MAQLVGSAGHGLMTGELRRIFLADGCDPACHTCEHHIQIGEQFCLLKAFQEDDESIETTVEVMVCWACRDKPLPEEQQAKARALAAKSKNKLSEQEVSFVQATIGTPRGFGCFVVNGQIMSCA